MTTIAAMDPASNAKALALHFMHLVTDADRLREMAVSAAVAKTRAELSSLSALEEEDAEAQLVEVRAMVEGLEGRMGAFHAVLKEVERRVEDWEGKERAGVLALQSPPEPGALLASDGSISKERGPMARQLLLLLLALGLTEPAVHLVFFLGREMPGWMGKERVVVM